MQQTTINRQPETHNVGAAFWLLAGLIVLLASGDAFAFLTAAAVIVTAAWWMIREIEHRIRKTATRLPTVLELRPALTGQPLSGQRDLEKTPAAWRGPRAA